MGLVAKAGQLATISQDIAESKLVEIKHPAPKRAEEPQRVLQA